MPVFLLKFVTRFAGDGLGTNLKNSISRLFIPGLTVLLCATVDKLFHDFAARAFARP